MKRALSLLLAASLSLSLAACGGGGGGSTAGSAAPEGSGSASSESLTPTQQIIQEAQGMTLEELAKRPSRSPTARPSTAWATPAAARVPCPYSLST